MSKMEHELFYLNKERPFSKSKYILITNSEHSIVRERWKSNLEIVVKVFEIDYIYYLLLFIFEL